MASTPTKAEVGSELRAVYAYGALACALTWSLAVPAAVAWTHHVAPPPYAIACAGLSAFGPLFAVLAIAGPRHQLRGVFGRWRTNPLWALLALFAPFVIHVVAAALYTVCGGHPSQWFHPPATPEMVAALVVFPLGEEFGWRGFAYPRLVARHGPVVGSLILGALWGLWHLMYSITPETASFDPFTFIYTMLELPLYSVLVAWVFERSNRSMAVAIAFHAGAHLDHIEHAPRTELGLHALHLVVVAILSVVAGRSLAARNDWKPDPRS